MSERVSRFARQAIKVDEARRRILDHAGLLGAEDVPLEEALGRRLAAAFHAPADVPHFRRSGLDGFAVRSADAGGASPHQPAELRVIGHSQAGTINPVRVEPGTAVRIMTGAVVPEGADAVVMFEQTDEMESPFEGQNRTAVRVKHPVKPGQNVAVPGEDLRRGEPLFAAGSTIGPGHLAVLAAFGQGTVSVRSRPVVGILSTGSELTDCEGPLAPGLVRNSNAPMLAAQTRTYGGVPKMLGMVKDDQAELSRVLAEALPVCDIIVTTGGVSVGDHDVMAELFRGESPAYRPGSTGNGDAARLLFNKVSMRPGSPTSAALIGGKLVLGLSGNPGACFVGFELFARPALEAMQGDTDSFRPIMAVAADDYPKGSPHDRYERAIWFVRDGTLLVRPAAAGKSSSLRSLPAANGLMIIPSGSTGIARGDRLRVIPLGREPFPGIVPHETE